jgi:hypothetical protein
MIDRLLHWLDVQVFRHHWPWLCDLAWDRQMSRDVESGAMRALDPELWDRYFNQ